MTGSIRTIRDGIKYEYVADYKAIYCHLFGWVKVYDRDKYGPAGVWITLECGTRIFRSNQFYTDLGY